MQYPHIDLPFAIGYSPAAAATDWAVSPRGETVKLNANDMDVLAPLARGRSGTPSWTESAPDWLIKVGWAMPILAKEVDQYPSDLLNIASVSSDPELSWWVFYTYPRREKQLMRHLLAREIPFYGPVIPRRFRSPSGIARTSYIPLFSNYVFLFGDEAQRYQAMKSNCVLKRFSVSDQARFTAELDQICRLIEMGRPLTPESRLLKGDRVRVTSGSFVGFEGTVIRRGKQIRLLVTIDFMQNGVLVELDDCRMERIEINKHKVTAT